MIETIGIIGAGQMGNGIAHVAALSGFNVTIIDVNAEQLDKALPAIEQNLNRQVGKNTITKDDKAAALTRIACGKGIDNISACDLVIEAAAENEALKKEIFGTLKGVLKPDAILCTNTSSISVTRLAASTDRPGKFMGMHFMNPVPRMELVELVRGIATDVDTYETIREVTLRMGKTPAMAEDFPAFIVNRILLPMINEAIYALYEGVDRKSVV